MGRRKAFRGKGKHRGKYQNPRPARVFHNLKWVKMPNQSCQNQPQTWRTIDSSLKETDVGITEHLREGPGFLGTIKSRFSDFHVNEIDVDGNEVKLTDQSVPIAQKKSLEYHELQAGKKLLENVITPEKWEELRELALDRTADKDFCVEIDVTGLGKATRVIIHETIEGQLGRALTKNTVTVGERKIIKCFNAKVLKAPKRNVWLWPGEYVYFVVHKENTDTVRAAADLAHHINCRVSSINYAGTKDKRAKTSQLMCIKRRHPRQIMKAAKKVPYMQVGNFSFHQTVLKLGDLKGNRFRIAIRQISGSEENIHNALKSIQEKGFINYYGLQRFGNCSGVPTYKVGIALLKSDYKQACELIMKPRTGEPPFVAEARNNWWKNRNSASAAAMLPNSVMEKKLLLGLAEYGENDYANALRKIPRNMLLLYTHSYQSLIWNRIASRRLKEFGLKLIPGDLVFKEKTDVEICERVDIIDEVDADCFDENAAEQDTEDTDNIAESHHKSLVKPLTDDDISANQYTIYDIVLPLPGYDITYPNNEISQWYEDMLGEEGLSSQKLKHNVKTYSLGGAYRKLFVKPENVSFEFKRYTSPASTLIASDWDELRGIKADEDETNGKFKALIVNFTLPSSTYATMALRELLECDSSVSSQQQLEKDLSMNSDCIQETTNDDTDASHKRKINETENESKKKKVE